jgi:hypothetical protein
MRAFGVEGKVLVSCGADTSLLISWFPFGLYASQHVGLLVYLS